MAQLSKKQKPRKRPKKPIIQAKGDTQKHANDNIWSSMSDLPWKKQAAIYNRMADLQWQINFTQMKLKRWSNLDNGCWTRLKDLNKAAKAELKDLTYV